MGWIQLLRNRILLSRCTVTNVGCTGASALRGGSSASGQVNQADSRVPHAPPLPDNQQDLVFGIYAIGLGATMGALAEPSWLCSVALPCQGPLSFGAFIAYSYISSIVSGSRSATSIPRSRNCSFRALCFFSPSPPRFCFRRSSIRAYLCSEPAGQPAQGWFSDDVSLGRV